VDRSGSRTAQHCARFLRVHQRLQRSVRALPSTRFLRLLPRCGTGLSMATGKHHDVLATAIDVAATGTSYVTFALGDDSGGSPQTTTPSMGSVTALTEARVARWRHRVAGIRPLTLTRTSGPDWTHSARRQAASLAEPSLPTSSRAAPAPGARLGRYLGKGEELPHRESYKSLRRKELGWLGGRDSNSERGLFPSG